MRKKVAAPKIAYGKRMTHFDLKMVIIIIAQ